MVALNSSAFEILRSYRLCPLLWRLSYAPEHTGSRENLYKHLLTQRHLSKQIQTNEDNTFCIDAANVEIEVIERDKIYKVTRSRENKRANLRLTNV